MDCSLLGSTIYGTSQARILEWIGHFLLQEIFPVQRLSLCLLHWQADSLPLSHKGNPSRSMLDHKSSQPRPVVTMVECERINLKTAAPVTWIMTPQRCPHPNTQNRWMAIRLWIWDGEVSLSCQVGGPTLIISILKSENLFQLRSGKIWLGNSGQRDEPCWLWRRRKGSLSRVRQETCRNWKKHRCGLSPEPPERRSRRYHQCLSFSPGRCDQWNCQITYLSWLKPPSVWSFVTATIGN